MAAQEAGFAAELDQKTKLRFAAHGLDERALVELNRAQCPSPGSCCAGPVGYSRAKLRAAAFPSRRRGKPLALLPNRSAEDDRTK